MRGMIWAGLVLAILWELMAFTAVIALVLCYAIQTFINCIRHDNSPDGKEEGR